MNKVHLPIGFLLGVLAVSTAHANVPNLIPVQGFLRDSAGNPVDESNTTLIFRLYDSSTSDTALWEETLVGVNVDKGYFSVYLGTETSLNAVTIIDAPELWLEMSIGAEVLGRTRLASVPFATEASQCTQVGDLTVNQIQSVITESCAEGSAIRAIGSDGTVTCEPKTLSFGNASTINFINAFDVFEKKIWTLFCIDIPDGGMLNVEVDISTHRHTSSKTIVHAALSRYLIYYSTNPNGNVNNALVSELTDHHYENDLDLSSESLSFERIPDTNTYRCTIDRTGMKLAEIALYTVVHVRGSGYNISNMLRSCD